MGDYLLWMLKYSEGIRKILGDSGTVNKMSYSELLQTLEKPENVEGYIELTDFLERLGTSNLTMEEKAIKMKENYTKYFKAA